VAGKIVFAIFEELRNWDRAPVGRWRAGSIADFRKQRTGRDLIVVPPDSSALDRHIFAKLAVEHFWKVNVPAK
jgi:hypothetical protein